MSEKNAEMKRQQIRKCNLAGKTLVLVGVIVAIVLVFIGAKRLVGLPVPTFWVRLLSHCWPSAELVFGLRNWLAKH